jgi:hypothetical protein
VFADVLVVVGGRNVIAPGEQLHCVDHGCGYALGGEFGGGDAGVFHDVVKQGCHHSRS